MRLLWAAFLAVLLAATTSFSQVVISVDENVSKNQDKNLWLALGASALLPGMGELYLGEKGLVRPFVWTDAALWLTAIGSYFIGERYVTSAHNYAVRYAGHTSDTAMCRCSIRWATTVAAGELLARTRRPTWTRTTTRR